VGSCSGCEGESIPSENEFVAFLSDPWGVATGSKGVFSGTVHHEVAFLSDPWGVATLGH